MKMAVYGGSIEAKLYIEEYYILKSEIKEKYISKDKIKEKIEELESEEPADDDYNFELQNDIHSKIDVLKELLEGE